MSEVELHAQLAALRQQVAQVEKDYRWCRDVLDYTERQLAASEQRCTIFEEALNDLQNAILDAQHLLDKEA